MPFCDTCGTFLAAEYYHPFNSEGKEVCQQCAPVAGQKPQFVTSCLECGRDGVELHSCQANNVKLVLDPYVGFRLGDSGTMETSHELVHCPSCGHIGPLQKAH